MQPTLLTLNQLKMNAKNNTNRALGQATCYKTYCHGTVWPDLAKFPHFGEFFSLRQEIAGKVSIGHIFHATYIGHLLMLLS